MVTVFIVLLNVYPECIAFWIFPKHKFLPCVKYEEAINWGRICFDVCLLSIISAWCVDDVQIFGLYRYTNEWLFIHKMHRNPQIANVFDIIASLTMFTDNNSTIYDMR